MTHAAYSAFFAELEKIAEEGTATKTDPGLWERMKAKATAKMGGKHSARAMQLATKMYKDEGGGYSGKKPSAASNSLKKWTKQDWQWTGKDRPGAGGTGVYLPKAKAARLKSSEEGRAKLRAASAEKREATRAGEQYSSHGLAAGTSLKKEAATAGNGTASGVATSHLTFKPVYVHEIGLPIGPHLLVESVSTKSDQGHTNYSLHPASGSEHFNAEKTPTLGHVTLRNNAGNGAIEITALYVDPQHRGKGYANALLHTAKLVSGNRTLIVKPDPFKDRGVSRSALEKIYKSHGFTDAAVPHLKGYLSLPPKLKSSTQFVDNTPEAKAHGDAKYHD